MGTDRDRVDAIATGRRACASAVTVESMRVEGGTVLRGHGHARPHLCAVLGGGFVERDRGRDVEVGPGGVRISPGGDEHRLRFARGGARCVLVLLESSLVESAAVRIEERRFEGGGIVSDLAARLRAELAGPVDAASPLVVESVALEMLARVARSDRAAASRPPAWLARVRDAIRESPRPFDAERLGELADRHPVYVARAFRRWYGTSPGEWSRSVRLDRARRALLQTDRSIARVALECGFADQAHLTRWIRRRLGVTPAILRRERKGLEVSSLQEPTLPPR